MQVQVESRANALYGGFQTRPLPRNGNSLKVCRQHVSTRVILRVSATQTSYKTAGQESATQSRVDIDSPYNLDSHFIESYRRDGFVKIPKVFDEPTLSHYGPAMSLEVKEADKTPRQQDPDYAQAFTQVKMQLRLQVPFFTQQCAGPSVPQHSVSRFTCRLGCSTDSCALIDTCSEHTSCSYMAGPEPEAEEQTGA